MGIGVITVEVMIMLLAMITMMAMSLIMLTNLAWGKHYLVQTADGNRGNYRRGNDYAADYDRDAADLARDADYVSAPDPISAADPENRRRGNGQCVNYLGASVPCAR